MRISFSSQEFKAIAVELRRASWGVAAFSAVMAHQQSEYSVLFYLSGASGWIAFQALAAFVDAIKGDAE